MPVIQDNSSLSDSAENNWKCDTFTNNWQHFDQLSKGVQLERRGKHGLWATITYILALRSQNKMERHPVRLFFDNREQKG